MKKTHKRRTFSNKTVLCIRNAFSKQIALRSISMADVRCALYKDNALMDKVLKDCATHVSQVRIEKKVYDRVRNFIRKGGK